MVQRTRPNKGNGFTLIELLVVIAIILILIAIALPNFLETQVRAKVVEATSEMRVLSIAVESYHGDRGVYPYLSVASLDYTFLTDGFRWLTSPVAYLTSLPIDPFSVTTDTAIVVPAAGPNYRFHSTTPIPMDGLVRWSNVDAYVIYSYGPNFDRDSVTLDGGWPFSKTENPCIHSLVPVLSYTPTNGTRSIGDIVRFGGEYRAGNWCLDGVRIIGRDSNVGYPWGAP